MRTTPSLSTSSTVSIWPSHSGFSISSESFVVIDIRHRSNGRAIDWSLLIGTRVHRRKNLPGGKRISRAEHGSTRLKHAYLHGRVFAGEPRICLVFNRKGETIWRRAVEEEVPLWAEP